MTPKDEIKAAKLRAHAELGSTLKSLVESPAFAGFFNGKEREFTEAMVKAAVDDDCARRNQAIKIELLRQLRTHFTDCVVRADRAEADLKKLEDKEKADADAKR